MGYSMDIRKLKISGSDDLTAWREAHPDTFAAELRRAVDAAQPIDLPDVDVDRLRTMQNTDVDRAEYLAERVAGRLIYVDGPGWYAYNGRCWENDVAQDAMARAMVHSVSRDLLATAAVDDANSGLLLNQACALRKSVAITAALTELRAVPSIRRRVEDLDRDPFLLVFRNGTVDLRSGTLRPHNPEDYITREVNLDYRPDAPCPQWLAFLESSQPGDPAMHVFLQRLAGYGITGSTREECCAFFYGSGRNGKGVFTETIRRIFGQIAVGQDAEFWEKQKYGRNGSLSAKMHGARLVFSSEMTDARLDEGFLKAFTAADPLTANQKYKAAYDFTPTALLIMSGNDKPTIHGTDDGIWQRMRCVPWDESFVGREDKGLKDRLLHSEAEGIAAWAVAGAVDWFAHGLNEPARVERATEEYREESDPYTEWAEARFAPDADGFVTSAEIKELGESAHPRPPGQPRAWTNAVVRLIGGTCTRRRVDGVQVRGVAGVSRRSVDMFYQPR